MSDITMVQGYTFPKGSAMDYAEYGGYGGPRGVAFGRFRQMRRGQDPSLFSTVPPLEGFGAEMNLPEMDVSPGAPPIDQQPGWGNGNTAPNGAGAASAPLGIGFLVLGLGLAWWAWQAS